MKHTVKKRLKRGLFLSSSVFLTGACSLLTKKHAPKHGSKHIYRFKEASPKTKIILQAKEELLEKMRKGKFKEKARKGNLRGMDLSGRDFSGMGYAKLGLKGCGL